MASVRLYVCCHKRSTIPTHALLVPIQVGRALAETGFEGYTADNTGDHISEKNRSYCELTAHYWAWKNDTSDFVGFFHYRRYLYPETAPRRPYRLCSVPTPELLDELGYGAFQELIEQNDMILPCPEEMYVPIREHYAAAPFHHGKDLELMEQILLEQHPDYAEAMERYLSGTQHFFGNIFIMRRSVFEDYCSWLFPLLEAFDERCDTTGYGPQELRVDGYLAERLLGIYCEQNRTRRTVTYLPRVHFYGLDGGSHLSERLRYAILPPGTKRRAEVKRLLVRRSED